MTAAAHISPPPDSSTRGQAPDSGSRGQAAPAFVWPVRVYWEDTDAGGIVYYANYLRYMERARTEWLRTLGCDQTRMRTLHRLQFVVARANVEFRRPGRLDDRLDVDVRGARDAPRVDRDRTARAKRGAGTPLSGEGQSRLRRRRVVSPPRHPHLPEAGARH